MRIVECQQLDEVWWQAHRGVPTASNFDRILTAKTMKPSAQQDDLIAELVAQTFMQGKMGPENEYQSAAMRNGNRMEPEARRWYEMEIETDMIQVGFVLDDSGRFGASPDSLVGTRGGLEIKCPTLKTQARRLMDGILPPDYYAQVHGELIVTGREWFDFVSYCPGLPPFKIRVCPNEYTEALRAELERFWDRYQRALAKMKG